MNLVCKGTYIVMFDYLTQKPVPVSADIRSKVTALEGRPVG